VDVLLPAELASSLVDKKSIRVTTAAILIVAVKPRAAIVVIVVIVVTVTVEINLPPIGATYLKHNIKRQCCQ